MAAGKSFGSASREPRAPRRSFGAPCFNEKKYFYRARVLRRARRVAASAGRQEHREAVMTSDEAAALVSRCYQAEWSAAVAHYNVAQLHQRLNQLEAAVAENIPPLPLPAVADSSAGAGAASGEDVTMEESAELAVQPSVRPDVQEAARPAGEPDVRPGSHPMASNAAQKASTVASASEPAKDAAATCTPDASLSDSAEAADRLLGRWAVLHGLQAEPDLNERLVRVGSQRPNGRFETVRPGSGRNPAVRPANLRVLLEEFNGRAAGDTMDFDDGEIELLGFDAQESYWACQKAHMYLWIPAYNFR